MDDKEFTEKYGIDPCFSKEYAFNLSYMVRVELPHGKCSDVPLSDLPNLVYFLTRFDLPCVIKPIKE